MDRLNTGVVVILMLSGFSTVSATEAPSMDEFYADEDNLSLFERNRDC